MHIDAQLTWDQGYCRMKANGAMLSGAGFRLARDTCIDPFHYAPWIDQKLAEFQKRNGGKPPNIFYILIDDIGFGDLGSETLNSIRGYKTPAINEIAREGMRMARMYTEPSCTPTRVAFMTGRQPYRNGMGNTSVDISGFGLAGKEVTLAEMLSEQVLPALARAN